MALSHKQACYPLQTFHHVLSKGIGIKDTCLSLYPMFSLIRLRNVFAMIVETHCVYIVGSAWLAQQTGHFKKCRDLAVDIPPSTARWNSQLWE